MNEPNWIPGAEYFYENFCTINGKKPVVRDKDREFFKAVTKARKVGKTLAAKRVRSFK